MKKLLLILSMIITVSVVNAGMVGLWNFNDSLINTVPSGSALSIDGSPTTSYIDNLIAGSTARVLQFSAFTSAQRIKMSNDATDPTRSYTLVFDVKFPVINSWTALLDFDHTGDSDFFIADNGLGIGLSGGRGTYDGVINQGTWYRIAVACQYDGSTIDMAKYIDGVLVGTVDDVVADEIDINDYVGFFNDTDGTETSAGVVNSIAYYDDAKDSTFIGNLGGPSASGIPVPEPASVILILTALVGLIIRK